MKPICGYPDFLRSAYDAARVARCTAGHVSFHRGARSSDRGTIRANTAEPPRA